MDFLKGLQNAIDGGGIPASDVKIEKIETLDNNNTIVRCTYLGAKYSIGQSGINFMATLAEEARAAVVFKATKRNFLIPQGLESTPIGGGSW